MRRNSACSRAKPRTRSRTLRRKLPNPALHVIEQAPSVHEGAPLAPLHCVPHVPQFAETGLRY